MELSGYEFGRVCDIDPDRTDAGVPKVVVPQPEYAKRDEKAVHDHGWGPFCAFGVPDEGTHRPGVYVLAVEDEVTYVGETQDLYAKFANGYGTISPADCFEGGGGTNCRLNTAIFHAVRAGERVSVHLHATDDFAGSDEENRALRRIIKDDLVTALNPAWNRTGGDGDRADGEGEREPPEPEARATEAESKSEAGAGGAPVPDDGDAEPDPIEPSGAARSAGGDSASDPDEAWFETERSGSEQSERDESDSATPDPSELTAEGFEPKPVEPERPRDGRSATPSTDRPAGEFAALYDYLVEHERDRVERSFAELEVVIEARLPTEARRWRRWWTNDEASHPHASAWLRAGYEVTEASLPEGRVTFERVDADGPSQSAGSAALPRAGVTPRRRE
ncbi:GIY-YIG nuclease family protein [Halogeometricum luteum]|uniref:GIY-YIG nuclease family protein n=1 Tax=Halogeometricum luteum TaxID=2950537 RepID=A0ABU2G0R3_9EURY|nr:GIY-YIG nuclease family protein [Halogeometricum sp. S3BR5-2]MDS0294377.1 GIY-YIG nuclease family protein [Halogeometricum sp. S3BR5-2]